MTNTKQHSAGCAGKEHTCWILDSIKCPAEPEKPDRQSGHQYIPMDVYVDPKTKKKHFQASSIRKRRAKKK
jgi:hypothetical protein